MYIACLLYLEKQGVKILSFMLRLTDDFKEGNTEEESVQYQKLISYSTE